MLIGMGCPSTFCGKNTSVFKSGSRSKLCWTQYVIPGTKSGVGLVKLGDEVIEAAYQCFGSRLVIGIAVWAADRASLSGLFGKSDTGLHSTRSAASLHTAAEQSGGFVRCVRCFWQYVASCSNFQHSCALTPHIVGTDVEMRWHEETLFQNREIPGRSFVCGLLTFEQRPENRIPRPHFRSDER